MRVKYSSNNSGGSWWLKDGDWLNLEASGWTVLWEKDAKEHSPYLDKEGRWLGALATKAYKEFETPGDAMREFERITTMKVSDNGCNCCGPPHTFYWGRAAAVTDQEQKDWENQEYGYAYGEECLTHLFGEGIPGSLREALERSNKNPD